MTKTVIIALVCLVFLLPNALYSQKPMVHDQPGSDFRLAIELYERSQYSAARQMFENVLERIPEKNDPMRINAQLHIALCAAQLFNPDAEQKLKAFMEEHPTHIQQNLVKFQTGNVIYRAGRFQEAAQWFAQVRVQDLNIYLQNEYFFKRGHSLFMINDFPLARQMFMNIGNPYSPYFPPATYYLGHIAFVEGSLTSALASFQSLEHDPTFGSIVPYYIVNIFYLQSDFGQVIDYGVPLLERASPERVPEIQRLLGEAWFRQGQYDRALPYLQAFMSSRQSNASRDDHYLLAFTHFRLNQFREAITNFEKVTGGDDPLSQNAHFHLASAYIQVNQYHQARIAFRAALENNHDPAITQDAIFYYAKLSYQLNMDQFNEAIEYFQRYISEFPQSIRANEATGFLVDIFLSTRNFREALSSLERIPINNPRLRSAYQRVAYNRGVELFNNNNFEDAIMHFMLSRRFPDNRSFTALSLYWQGQAEYRRQNYQQAIDVLQQFITSPGAINLNIFHQAHYTLGYSHFNISNYTEAIAAFRRFISARGQQPRLVNDALLRIADSYFMNRLFAQAIEFYNRAINQNVIDREYALFQIGMANGAMGRHSEKISQLQNLITTNATGNFVDEALYEIGNSWLLLANNPNALESFSRLIAQHPNSANVKSAMLKSGLIHFNDNRNDQALAMFREVINRYPGTIQAQEALAAMRNIHVEQGRVDDFIQFSQGLGFANITVAQQDSLTYMAAETQFMRGDCINASISFTNYLSRFPQGIFANNANFYLAECFFRANELQQALTNYQLVINRARSGFTENAMQRAAIIEERLGNHASSLDLFRRLENVAESPAIRIEAQIGQARTLYQLQRFRESIVAANAITANQRASIEHQQQAHLLAGKSAMSLSQPIAARTSFRSAMNLTNNALAAEAMYNLALIEYNARNFQQAETMIFEFVSRMSAQEYWLAKTFILLADTYLAMGNIFQAKHTLQSIIDNYQGSELRELAVQKLNAIVEAEQRQRPAGQRPTDVNIGRN